MSEDENIADPLAAMHQAKAGLAMRADLLYGYFNSLTTEGFTRPEALEIVVAYQTDQWPVD